MEIRLTNEQTNKLAQSLHSLHQHEKFNCVFQRHGIKKLGKAGGDLPNMQ